MNVRQLEDLRDKILRLKEQKDRANMAQEMAKENLLKYANSLADAKNKLVEINAQIEKETVKLNAATEKLSKMVYNEPNTD